MLIEIQWGLKPVNRSIWRMSADIIQDEVGRATVQTELHDYLEGNWGKTSTRSNEWEALKAVIREKCIGLTIGVRKILSRDLQKWEKELTTIQVRVAGGTNPLTEQKEILQKVVQTRDKLEKYTLQSYRQLLHREGGYTR